MLRIIKDLFSNLNNGGVEYCHWKSNIALGKALAGDTDLDLLVKKDFAQKFEQILSNLGFKRAVTPEWYTHPSIFHYYSYDVESGKIVHLHAYFRIITGGCLVKNYRLPLEEMLLKETVRENGIRVPTRHAELIVFMLRKMVEHNLLELPFILKEYAAIQSELRWLSSAKTNERAIYLLKEYFPQIHEAFFIACIKSLQKKQILRSFVFGWVIRRRLRHLKISSIIMQECYKKIYCLVRLLFYRLFSGKQINHLFSGGSVIAFVGPEAVGKSTIISMLEEWLGHEMIITKVHVGKPPSTWLTVLPNLFLPIARKIYPQQRTSNWEAQSFEKPETILRKPSLLFMIRSVTIGYDRLRLLIKTFRKASKGVIVLCDRYPMQKVGAVDSAQLRTNAEGNNWVRRFLTRLEHDLYRAIPKPDGIVLLTTQEDVAVKRNAKRFKKEGTESEECVRRRHKMMSNPQFANSIVYQIDTNKTLEETIHEVKSIVWNII